MQSSIRPLNAAGFLALGALLWPAPAVAQQSSDTDSGIRTPRVATAVRVERLAPRLDGVLDDEIWQNAPVFSGFLQRDPDEGEPGTEQTEFRVAYADDAIYVAVRAYDSHADQISAHLTRRDAFSPSDWIGIQIDSYRDRRTGFEFVVNPAGVKRDRYLYDDNSSDGSWNAVWDVATMIDAGGWSAEFRIPLSQLRFSQAEDNVFGFNVYRDINRNNERQYWRLLPKGESGVVSLFGDLVGLRGISPPRRVEVLPYTVMSNATSPAQDGNPFQTGTSRSMTMGADVNIGLTSALTLSATFFPD
ncbi:MAG: carbohydrate binding family 9 domain-containing protein, partial [Gemmatimonadales bacterium]